MKAVQLLKIRTIMKMKNKLYFLLLAFSIFFTACGGGNQEKASEPERETTTAIDDDSGNELTDAMKKVQESVEKLKDGEAVEVVDFRELRDLLPERLAGMKRASTSGEKTGAMGFNVSTAEATYEDGDSRLEVKITDAAGVGMALLGLAAWSTVEIDRESDDGYERTTLIEGHKGFEKYDRNTRRGELSLIVAERFIVNIEGRDVDEKVFRNAVKKLNLGKLEKM